MRHHFLPTDVLVRLDLNALVEDHGGRNFISEEEVNVWFQRRRLFERLSPDNERRVHDEERAV